jgi:hypothetical protein
MSELTSAHHGAIPGERHRDRLGDKRLAVTVKRLNGFGHAVARTFGAAARIAAVPWVEWASTHIWSRRRSPLRRDGRHQLARAEEEVSAGANGISSTTCEGASISVDAGRVSSTEPAEVFASATRMFSASREGASAVAGWTSFSRVCRGGRLDWRAVFSERG